MHELSTLAETYVKVIWNAGEWIDEPVTVGALATRLGFTPSTVSEAIRKLDGLGLVSHARYGAIELTKEGRLAALAMVRKHRLLETFLVTELGYTWDEVHDDAEILEHACSDRFIERLADKLGDPTRDPHGDPIPRSDGTLPPLDAAPLDHVDIGTPVRVAQVSDADPELLRYLDQQGIGLDSELVVYSRNTSIGTLTIEHAGTTVTLGLHAARAIRVLAA